MTPRSWARPSRPFKLINTQWQRVPGTPVRLAKRRHAIDSPFLLIDLEGQHLEPSRPSARAFRTWERALEEIVKIHDAAPACEPMAEAGECRA